MARIKLQIEFDASTLRLNNLKRKLSNLDDFSQDASLIMEARVKEYFARQAGPGGPWAPLAPSTVAQKGVSTILRETGALINAVQSTASGNTAKVSNSMSYAIYSQFGTSRQPARPHLGFDQELIDRLKRELERYLEAAI